MTDDSEDSNGDKQKKQVGVMPREKVSESKSEASRDISDGLVARAGVAKNAKHETPKIIRRPKVLGVSSRRCARLVSTLISFPGTFF